MENIAKIFASEDKNEIKEAFKNVLIQHFDDQLNEMDIYLFDPDIIQDKINDAFDEIIENIKPKFQKKIEKYMENIFDKKLNELNKI